MNQQQVLVVDDEPDIRDLVREILEDEGYAVHVAADAAGARDAVGEMRPDLVLLDIWMPDEDGISLLKSWKDTGELDFPIVMISGHGTVETAVEATRLGAVDFIEKPLSLARLLLTVEKAISSYTPDTGTSAGSASGNKVEPLVGASAYITAIREQIEKAASDSDSGALIVGERATGKQLIARHLHAASARSSGPLVSLRCDSISSSNAARDLLGNANTAGFLESAANGTLCLIDVEELPGTAQTVLLNTIESGKIARQDAEPVGFKARLVATSSSDLQNLVDQQLFHPTLYYRLAVLVVRTLPLREHREDVPALLAHYVDRLVEQQGLPYRHFAVAAQNRLRNMDWPGNIMELINLVQRLLILGDQVEIGLDEIEDLASPGSQAGSYEVGADVMRLPLDLPMREARAEFEKLYLQRQLEKVDGNIVELARNVGMERTHLYRKLRSVGIQAGRKRSEQ